MTIAPRDVIGAVFALVVVCLIGWLSTNMWGYSHHRTEPVGTVEITPLD